MVDFLKNISINQKLEVEGWGSWYIKLDKENKFWVACLRNILRLINCLINLERNFESGKCDIGGKIIKKKVYFYEGLRNRELRW